MTGSVDLRRDLIVIGILAALLVAAAVAAHEIHYRRRAARLAAARNAGLAARVEAIEAILTEDRLS
jgi:hypothetical protein